MMRPRGTPPTPIAASSDREVVDIAGTSETSRSPKRMIDPLPNLFSILSSAASMARLRSAIRSSGMIGISFFCSSSVLVLVVIPCVPQLDVRENTTTQAGMEQRVTDETEIFPEGQELSTDCAPSAALSALPIVRGERPRNVTIKAQGA